MTSCNPPEKDLLIKTYGTISLYQIGKSNLSEFSEFVFKMYSHHYLKKHQWLPDTQELEYMKHSDINQFEDSVYFGFRNSKQELLGTIKATKRTNDIVFPIENEFNISIEQIIEKENLEVNKIWHLGRLAIDSNVLRSQNLSLTSRQMLRVLLIHSLGIISYNPNSLMIAESDVLIYQIFRDLGIEMQIVGELRDCLGSPTYPVILTSENIEKWLEENFLEKEEQQKILI
ncbi:hypothetical protein ATE84_2013 [Aquimarina sp. MAR_2010_214]|uniref:hypothetical protein n=1 Tax=Aquimarina sp. MAR_2010_214 TaxID=1250026 RepID=UPI000C6FEFAD|nr:hypothetical protein [Aquimarina sp. MAR_2010_214]PKV49967.1 hypothetical protein ATE84_2013 [Aquimarina sp. MAR_2010_214]